MGVGGGFLTFPIFVYGLGVSTFTTVGTDILQIIFTTSYSAIFKYAIYGYVFYSLCIGMLLSLFAVQIGAMVTKVVTGSQVRAFYALTILAGFINRLFALPKQLSESGYLTIPQSFSAPIELVGTIIFFGIVGFFSLWILYTFFKNFKEFRPPPPIAPPIVPPTVSERSDDDDFVHSAALADIGAPIKPPLIVRPKLFLVGTLGLLTFILSLVIPGSPFFFGTLADADSPFNQVTKFSANHTAQGYTQAKKFDKTEIDFVFDPRERISNAERAVEILAAHEINASLTAEGHIRIIGNLGELARLAIDDAKVALEKNIANKLENKKGVSYHEMIYYWWVIFHELTDRYHLECQEVNANFCEHIMARQLEPAYNFREIDAHPAGENTFQLIWLLSIYVFATIWYGAALYCFTEGIGLSLSKSHKKAEH